MALKDSAYLIERQHMGIVQWESGRFMPGLTPSTLFCHVWANTCVSSTIKNRFCLSNLVCPVQGVGEEPVKEVRPAVPP